MRKILDIQLNDLRKRLEKKRIELNVSQKAEDYLVEKGYDPKFGARPLKRLIQSEINNKIAIALIKDWEQQGDKNKKHPIFIDIKNDKIAILKNQNVQNND